MNYGVQIIKQKEAKSAVLRKMEAYLAKEAEGDTLSPDEANDFDSLKKQVDEHDARIGRLEAVQAAAIDAAEPVNASIGDDDDDMMGAGKRLPMFNIKTSDSIRVARKGHDSAAGRFLVGHYYVKTQGLDTAKRMIEKVWGDNQVSKALTLTTAQPIIPQDFSLELIPLLTAVSVFRPIANVFEMPRGQITRFRQARGSTASYFGEGVQVPVSALQYDNLQFNWHQYGAFSYCTKQMLAFTPLDAAKDITRDLVNKSSLFEDYMIAYGSGTYPQIKGIAASVNSSNILQNTTVSGAVNFQTVSYDLAATELALTGNLIQGNNFTWVMSPYVKGFLKQLSSSYGVYPFKEDLNADILNGFPVKTTRQSGTNLGASNANLTDIFLVNNDDLLLGDAFNWEIEMTTEGSFLDGSTQINAFGQNLVAFKLTNAHDFQLAHDVSAAVLQASAWSLGNTSAGIAEYDQTLNTTGSSASSAED